MSSSDERMDCDCCKDLISCSLCNEKFHIESIGMDQMFYETLSSQKYPGVVWHCNKCMEIYKRKLNITNLIAEMKDDLKSDLCSEMKKEMSIFIQSKFEAMLDENKAPKSNIHTDRPWQMMIFPSNVVNPKTTTKHTIAVTSEDINNKKLSETAWCDIVKNNIEPNLRDIPVLKTTLTASGKGIIFFPSADTRDKAASKLEGTCSFEAQDRSNKSLYPKIKISDIPKEFLGTNEKETLKDAIMEKNPDIRELVNKEKKIMDIIFIHKEKLSDSCFAVVKVDDAIKTKIMLQGRKVYIGLSSCRVSERYHLTQCYVCQEFGHRKGSTRCRLKDSDKAVCLYCSEEHSSKSCQNKKNTDNFKCINCANSKKYIG